MNLFGLSPGEIILIMMVAMVVVGPERLPDAAASVGKWIREFRRVTTELTQQYSDDNPFTELQRAFSLTELTNSLNSPLTGTAASAATPAVEGSGAVAEAQVVAATQVVPGTTAPSGVVPVLHSVYFDHQALNVPVEDEWTHSGLDPTYSRPTARWALSSEAIVDEWSHGVPWIETKVADVDVSIADTAVDELVTAEDAFTSDLPGGATYSVPGPALDFGDTLPPQSSDPVPPSHEHDDQPVSVGASSSAGGD